VQKNKSHKNQRACSKNGTFHFRGSMENTTVNEHQCTLW